MHLLRGVGDRTRDDIHIEFFWITFKTVVNSQNGLISQSQRLMNVVDDVH
jgi:hypothetical protein